MVIRKNTNAIKIWFLHHYVFPLQKRPLAMFRKVGNILLILLYLVIFFQPLVPIIIYHVNYNYIVKNECVNRDKPWMHCNGKCYLHKQLDDVFEGNQKHPLNLSLRDFKFPEFTELQTGFSLACPVIISKKPVAFYLDHYKSNLFNNIFRPPQSGC